MARMIPPVADPSTLSSGERKVFSLLENDPATHNWLVFHSLGLAHRGRSKPYGEIDFVVLVPGAGVCCLEVKGGRIACRDGVWTTTDRDDRTSEMTRSPFMQVREGMFALKNSVQSRAPLGFPQHLTFAAAVVFPDVSFRATSPEWARWQLIDRDDLARPISDSIIRLAHEQRALEPGVHGHEPTPQTVSVLKHLLRPDFDCVVSRGTQIADCEERLLSLTTEQYGALDLLADNLQCLFKGAAGTGKTMLALEYAKRMAAAGNRTLLLCFNRLLGDWLNAESVRCMPATPLTATTYHRFMREMILETELGDEFRQAEASGDKKRLYGEIYPTLGQLAADECGTRYDVIVLDEAQDLLGEEALHALGALLAGGIATGRWAIFGDFERQAIFRPLSAPAMEQTLRTHAPHFAIGRLTQNCRNTRYIAEETALLSGFESFPYRTGQIAGLPVDYRYHSDDNSQKGNFIGCVDDLLRHNVRPEDIVVLSRLKLENSGLSGSDAGQAFRLLPVGQRPDRIGPKAVLRFATIQAFKGMESPVIILADVDGVADSGPQSLLYVAMSRARSHLTVLVHNRTKSAIHECLRRRFAQGN